MEAVTALERENSITFVIQTSVLKTQETSEPYSVKSSTLYLTREKCLHGKLWLLQVSIYFKNPTVPSLFILIIDTTYIGFI